jgi:methionine-rich copper-binding protein CopC
MGVMALKTMIKGENFQKSGLFFVLIILLLFAVSMATLNTSHAAATLYVNGTSGNDTYDGTNPIWVSGTIGPKKTIQNASNAVDTSGTVHVASGTYQEHLLIQKNLNLIGENPETTIIDGTNNDRGLWIGTNPIVSISNFTITNCTTAGQGGGIYVYTDATLTINNCIIIKNTANTGGGILNFGTMAVYNSTVTGNTAVDRGGGIWSGFIPSSISTIKYCRLTNNTAASGNEIYQFTGTVDAQYNWWGQNTGPQTGQIVRNLGTITSSPWLYMTLTANPTMVLNGASSTLTASFNNASDGTIITPFNPASGHLPDGSVVIFTTDWGNVGSKTTTKNTKNGIATATLTANEGTGTAHLTAQLDSQIVNTNVEIADILYVNGATGNDIWDGTSPTYISSTTGPMKTIQTALNAITTGGTVNVASGTYPEHITISKNLNLVGSNPNTTIIDGTHTGRTVDVAAVGNVNIANFTILNGTSIFNGGGIYSLGGLNINNCIITNNTVMNMGGGIYAAGTQTVNNSVITGNTATSGGGIAYGWNTLNVTYSLLTNNTATYGSEIYQIYSSSILAQYNWWGQNTGPIAGQIDGTATSSPWLVLTINATPSLIKKSSTSSITADLNHDSGGSTVSGHVMDGLPLTLSTTLGIVNSPVSTVNGVATATLNGGAISGVADVSATVDSQTVHTSVTVDATTPTVTSTNPAQYAVNLPSNQVFTVTFSEAIKAANLNIIILKTSTGTVIATTKTITGNVLTITPNSALSEAKYLLLLYAGCVTDLAGNPSAALSRTYGVGAQPYVTSIDPANYALNVARNKVITATFNEPIVAKYLTLIYLKTVTGGIQVATIKSVSGNVLTITPTSPLAAGTRYMLLIYTFAVTDLAGNSNVNKAISFTTGAT